MYIYNMKIPIPDSIEAIIFDLDGTLADTMPVHYKACQLVCNEHGFDFPLDFFIEKAGMPTITVFELLMKELDLNYDGEKLGQKKEEKFLELIPEVKAIPEVESILLNYLNKIPLAIGSGGQNHSIDLTLKAIGHEDKFDAIVGCEDVANHKPEPDTFLKAAKLMNVSPENCLVLEDGEPGIVAATRANMIAINVKDFIGEPNYQKK